MYELEAKVVDQWTNGNYFRAIDGVLQTHQFPSVESMLERISLADLHAALSFFPPTHWGESGVRLGSLLVTFTLRWAELEGGGKKEKVNGYRAFKEYQEKVLER